MSNLANNTISKTTYPIGRTVHFEPGFDFIVNGPRDKAKFGRHGLSIRFLYKGDKGAIQFLVYTHWLPMINTGKEGLDWWKPTYESHMEPMAADISYHSPVPLRDWQKEEEPTMKECSFLEGKPCYSDGSTLNADRYFAILRNDGEEALWAAMEEYYQDTFEGGEDD